MLNKFPYRAALDVIDFNGFLRLVERFMFAQFSDEEIIKAFDIYRQNDAKYITVNDLRYAVKQLNQDISNEELQVN